MSDLRNLPFKYIFQHLISKGNGIVLKSIDCICAFLNNLSYEFLRDTFDHSFMNHPYGLRCDVSLILLVIDMLNRFFNDINNEIVWSLAPHSAEFNALGEHDFNHVIDYTLCSFVK